MVSRHAALTGVDSDVFNRMRKIFENVDSVTVRNGKTEKKAIIKDFDEQNNSVIIQMENVNESHSPYGLFNEVKDELRKGGLEVIYTECSSWQHLVGTQEQSDEYWKKQLGRPLLSVR